jgi:hypothetical protein
LWVVLVVVVAVVAVAVAESAVAKDLVAEDPDVGDSPKRKRGDAQAQRESLH